MSSKSLMKKIATVYFSSDNIIWHMFIISSVLFLSDMIWERIETICPWNFCILSKCLYNSMVGIIKSIIPDICLKWLFVFFPWRFTCGSANGRGVGACRVSGTGSQCLQGLQCHTGIDNTNSFVMIRIKY